MTECEEYYLAHYGVLGMKWGVRKGRKAVKAKRKEYRKAIRNADNDAEKAKLKAEYKKYKTGGRTKAQRFGEFMLGASADTRAYMEMGYSHGAAFGRSMADLGVTAGIITAAASVGKTVIQAAYEFM